MKQHLSRVAPIVVALALVSASCGGEDSPSAGSTLTGSASTTPPEPQGGRGWLEGDDLNWMPGASATGEADAVAPVELAADGEMMAEPAASTARSGAVDLDIEAPTVADESPLQAGSIDDSDDFAAYQAYRDRILAAGVPVRLLDLDDPTVISVTGNNGLPVLDAVVTVGVAVVDQQGQAIESSVSLRTTADGTTRFLPDAHIADGGSGAADGPWDVTVDVGEVTASTSFTRGEELVELVVDVPGGVVGSVPVDVHFLLDATGSMGDEIDRLRTNMASVAEQISALRSDPDVRFGMTVYRDEGDLFVTRTFDLTDDLSSFLVALGEVVADGGGDYPEALDEALADALELPEWRRDGAVELVVLIADAPPQIGRSVPVPYPDSALSALGRGVKILPVAASGTDDQAEYVFRELAFITGGRFVFLSYGVDGSGGTATGSGTDITPDDYDELPLDQLVVRLVEDEIRVLTGGEDSQPPATTTTSQPPTTTQ